MSLQDLNQCYLTAQVECDSLLSHFEGGLPAQFMDAYVKKVTDDPSFCSYKEVKWLGDSGIVQFTTNRTNKHIFFPSIGFLIAARLVPFYRELLLYRQCVVEILSDNGTNIDDQEDNNGNVNPVVLGYVDTSSRINTNEKNWLKKFLSETKNTPNQWWGKGKEIKRANDFFVSPLMKAARLNAETQSEIADIAKQLSDNPELLDMLSSTTNLSKEFEEWLIKVHKKPNGKVLDATAISSYIRALEVSTKQNPDGSPANNHGKVIWHNIYYHLHGSSAPKGVFQVDNFAEFDTIFGPLKLTVNKGKEPSSVISQHFTEIQQWIAGQTGGAFLPPALNLYEKFLQWREAQKKPEDKKDELPPNVDRLSIALKLFAAKRSLVKPVGWDSYDAWTKSVRSEFVAVDESLANEPGFDYLDYIRKYSVSGFVANTSYASHSENEKRGVLRFLKEQFNSPKPASWYIDSANRLVVDGNQVKGMSPKAMLYFMSELHPEEFAAWTEPTYEQLEFLGLHKGATPSDLTIETYEDCKAKQQLIVAKMKELKIGKVSDDPSAPDYRTANEFLWWLGQDDNKDLIKEKIMSKVMKPVERKPYDKTKSKKKTFTSEAEDQLMLRILAALRTKPFVILAGHSGTGKSRMVKKLAYMTCRDKALHEGSDPGNYCMIEVKPNWHDSTDLLGYSSSFGSNHYVVKPLIEFIQKAYAYPDVPFFVCLDEMNLAPVEQYFAEFLSALEDIHEDSDAMNAYFALNANYKPADSSAAAEVVKYTSAPLVKALEYFDSPGMLAPKFNESSDWVKTHGLTIPKNLFVVGTVNMDETTNQFSRKVLDRAFTIEMTDARFEDFGDHGKDPAPSFVEEADIDHALIDALLKGKKQYGQVLSKKSNDDDPNGQLENMNALKGILADTPFVVAYRFANEYALYEEALNVMDGTDGLGNSKAVVNAQKAFDDVVLMKLLPRIAGEVAVVKALFEGVKKSDGTKEKSGLLDLLKCSEKGDQDDDTASGKKMREILKRGKRLLYLTFWP